MGIGLKSNHRNLSTYLCRSKCGRTWYKTASFVCLLLPSIPTSKRGARICLNDTEITSNMGNDSMFQQLCKLGMIDCFRYFFSLHLLSRTPLSAKVLQGFFSLPILFLYLLLFPTSMACMEGGQE